MLTQILFEDFVLNGTQTGPRVKSERGRGGLVSNVVFKNISMYNVENAFQITEYYIDPPPPTNASATPHFKNITLDSVVAYTKPKVGAYFDGRKEEGEGPGGLPNFSVLYYCAPSPLLEIFS